MNRETWLNELAAKMAPRFEELGHPLPKFRVSIGFTSAGAHGGANQWRAPRLYCFHAKCDVYPWQCLDCLHTNPKKRASFLRRCWHTILPRDPAFWLRSLHAGSVRTRRIRRWMCTCQPNVHAGKHGQ